jgi:hypothetical protein
MFRYVGLISLDRADNLVDGHGPLFENLQNTQPARLSQNLESSGHQVDHFPANHGRLLLDAAVKLVCFTI